MRSAVTIIALAVLSGCSAPELPGCRIEVVPSDDGLLLVRGCDQVPVARFPGVIHFEWGAVEPTEGHELVILWAPEERPKQLRIWVIRPSATGVDYLWRGSRMSGDVEAFTLVRGGGKEGAHSEDGKVPGGGGGQSGGGGGQPGGGGGQSGDGGGQPRHSSEGSEGTGRLDDAACLVTLERGRDGLRFLLTYRWTGFGFGHGIASGDGRVDCLGREWKCAAGDVRGKLRCVAAAQESVAP